MNLLAFVPILSVMMIMHELGHFLTARWFGITVQEFGIGLPPRVWSIKRGGVVYSLNAIPFGAFVKMLGEEDPTAPGSFASKSRWIRGIVLAAGSGMNLILAVIAFSLAFMVGVPVPTAEGPIRIDFVAPGSPAEQAGLQAGDSVISFAGQPVSNGDDFRTLARQNLDQPVPLTVQRPDGPVTTTLAPRSNPPEGQGAIGVVLRLNTRLQQFDPLTSIQNGLIQTKESVAIVFMIPKLLIEGVITPADARPIGLPGMAQVTAQAVDHVIDTGFWYPLFTLTGTFSAGLAVANMLPIPALDGGRFFFVILEWIRGRRIPPEREAQFHFVGIMVLLTLMLVISFNDIVHPVPQIDWGGN